MLYEDGTSDRSYYDKLLDFTGFDFDSWKTDEDRVRTPTTFRLRRSDWAPRPIALIFQHNEKQSSTMDLTPAELVDLHDRLGEFIEEHSLRDHT